MMRNPGCRICYPNSRGPAQSERALRVETPPQGRHFCWVQQCRKEANVFGSRKQLGEWVEMQFMARAAANGFTVSKPWGDSVRYDFAVEKGGVFRRVQVKGTASHDGKSYVCNTVWSAAQGRTRRYARKDVD